MPGFSVAAAPGRVRRTYDFEVDLLTEGLVLEIRRENETWELDSEVINPGSKEELQRVEFCWPPAGQ